MEVTKLPNNYTAVEMSPEEALDLIGSLAKQLREKSPNVGRKEFRDKKGEYISHVIFFPVQGKAERR